MRHFRIEQPITIRGLTLRNRVIFPATGTKLSGNTSFVTDALIDYHTARVDGGSGLNIVEVSSVHTPSAPRHFLFLSEDMYIPGHKKLVDAIHAHGGKAGVQHWQGSLCEGLDQTAQILMASDMPMGPGITLPGITVEQIREVVECYGKAATRAVAAGYDCIEFHCAHNYLPHSFLSGGKNHRTDEYGGSLENRARFPLEALRAIRANMPDTMPYPIHWGRVGDPINPSIHDYYALSKVFSELAVFESGLKYWVSIRQTGQHPSAEGAGEQPIIWHQPPNNVLEWSTSIESGICMANVCEAWVPESFWRKGYNLSSGKGYRLATWELMDITLKNRSQAHGHLLDEGEQRGELDQGLLRLQRTDGRHAGRRAL